MSQAVAVTAVSEVAWAAGTAAAASEEVAARAKVLLARAVVVVRARAMVAAIVVVVAAAIASKPVATEVVTSVEPPPQQLSPPSLRPRRTPPSPQARWRRWRSRALHRPAKASLSAWGGLHRVLPAAYQWTRALLCRHWVGEQRCSCDYGHDASSAWAEEPGSARNETRVLLLWLRAAT